VKQNQLTHQLDLLSIKESASPSKCIDPASYVEIVSLLKLLMVECVSIPKEGQIAVVKEDRDEQNHD